MITSLNVNGALSEMFSHRVSSSNYKALDLESAFSQHMALSRKDYKRAGLDDDASNDIFEEDNSPAEAGVIDKIVLQNFMCHDYFELSLGPQLNFIIGRNGSGKSAILTSLSVGLGCKANETDRGKNLKALIKRGTNTAKIVITFRNEGDFGFQHEKFGDRIIVERILRVDGGSGYSLKAANKKTVSTKKADLDAMLEYFGITINNPLAFLSQGAAKTFLAASTDEDKYSFFMKGIQMEQAINEYMHSNGQLDKIHQEIDLRNESIHGLKQDAENVTRVYKKFHESKNLRDNKKALSGKLIWLQIVTKEKDIEILKGKERQLQQQIDETDGLIRDRNESIGATLDQRKELDRTLEEIEKKTEELQEDSNKIKDQVNSHETNITDLELRIGDLQKDNSRKRRAIESYDLKIQQETKRQEVLNGGTKDGIVEKIQGLKDSKERDQAEVAIIAEKISEEEDNYKSFTSSSSGGLGDKKSQVQELMRLKDSLARSEKDKYAPYHVNMKHVIREVENDSGFKVKPIGPLGIHFSIKQGYEEWAPLFEKVFKQILDGFLVENQQDHKRLLLILKKYKVGSQIITRKFERFNFNSDLASKGLTRIIDALDFVNEDVKYTMIDSLNIERTVLEKNPERARKIAQNHNLKYCYSFFDAKSGARYQLNPKTKSFRSDPIYYLENNVPKLKKATNITSEEELQRLELKISQAKLELKEEEKKHEVGQKEIVDRLQKHKNKYKELRHSIHSLNQKVDKLEQQLEGDQDTSKLNSYMEEKSNLDREIKINENAIADAQRQSDGLESKFRNIKKQYKTIRSELEEQEALRETQIRLHKKNLQEEQSILTQIDNQKVVQRKKQAIVNTINEKIPMMTSQIEKEIPNAEQWCSRDQASIDLQTDNTDDIKQQILLINQQLSEVSKNIGKTEDEIINEYNQKTTAYKYAREQLLKAHNLRDKLSRSIFNRMKAGRIQREMLCLAADNDFSSSLSQRGFEGKLVFDFEKKKLKMMVGKDGKPPRAVNSLSGGEKSFTQIALLLAIWKPMRSKIRGLDEFDVFMDTVNRRISMKLMLDSLRKEPKSQTIFITPQDIGHLKGIDAADVTIHKLKDPARKNNSTNN